MARITVEDCLKKVNNRYALVLMATKRVRQFAKGDDPLVKSKNRHVVTALREIAAGKVRPRKGGARPAPQEAEEALPH